MVLPRGSGLLTLPRATPVLPTNPDEYRDRSPVLHTVAGCSVCRRLRGHAAYGSGQTDAHRCPRNDHRNDLGTDRQRTPLVPLFDRKGKPAGRYHPDWVAARSRTARTVALRFSHAGRSHREFTATDSASCPGDTDPTRHRDPGPRGSDQGAGKPQGPDPSFSRCGHLPRRTAAAT